MSGQVIRDIVIPIVAKIMREDGYFPYGGVSLRDEELEKFLEEEMRGRFGVIGSNGCQHLKEQLEMAMKNDPYSFEYVLRQALSRYVRLQVKMRQLKKKRPFQEGPPDRFAEQRRMYRMLFGGQESLRD